MKGLLVAQTILPIQETEPLLFPGAIKICGYLTKTAQEQEFPCIVVIVII